MKNKLERVAHKIIASLEQLVSNENDWSPKVYIGKTDDEVRRAKEHLNEDEPLVYLTVLAEGTRDNINELEKRTIGLLKKSAKLKMQNIKGGGGGDVNSTKLYVAFTELFPTDELGEYELKLLGDEFPIIL